MDYSTHQQQEQQQPQPQQQGYDSSQNQQPFDQQSYYAYNQQQYEQHQQQYAAYYASQQQQQYQQEATNPTIVHPPGVPLPVPEQPHIQNQQFASHDSSAAMNPSSAAIAALSHLTHFAENPMIGQSQYRGGGRGSRPFRRGGRGYFNPRGRGSYHGGGRGRGGGRHFPSHSSESVPAAVGVTSVAQQPSLEVSGPSLVEVPAATIDPPACKFWCEICKVECNSAEILEQHKNGKRHKKNSQVHEELQRRKAIDGQQISLMPSSNLDVTTQGEKALELNTEGSLPENMISGGTCNIPKNELDSQNTVSPLKVPADEEKPRDDLALRGRGSKRKKRGGRGGKHLRSSDGSRMPVEPPKPKQPISFICELCNVICESQVVYDSHLIGKKHQANFRRVYGHQAVSQEPVPQAVLPTNASAVSNPIDINALASSINTQVQQGVNDPQVLLAQLLVTLMSQAQASTAGAPTGPVAAQFSALMPGAGSSYGPAFQNVPPTQVAETAARVGNENPTGKGTDQVLSDSLLANAPQTAGGSSEADKMEHETPTENPSAAIEQGSSKENAPTS